MQDIKKIKSQNMQEGHGLTGEATEKQNNMENALHDSQELYTNLISAIPDIILQTDMNGKIVFINDVGVQIGGYSGAEEFIGKDILLFFAPEDHEKTGRNITQMLESKIGSNEYRLIAQDGSTIPVEVNGNVIRNADGSPHGRIYVCRNITERKRTEGTLESSFQRLRKALGGTVQAIAVTVERRDPYTAGHQRRVSDLARSIATEMGLTRDQIDGIRMASTIHDIGKISIPAEILSKPTKLTYLEIQLINTHPQSGYDILKDIDFPWPIARIILEHHEKMDGSGYPNGVKGNETLLESKILTVADVVEAIASHRPYRPALGINAALDEINRNKGVLYDPEVVAACLRLFNEKGYKLEG